jgi:beta-galactosidase
MVGHGNPETQRCFQESKVLGNELAGVPEIAGSRVATQCGIYFDYENWWALEGPAQPNNDLTYNRPIDGFYQALFEANLATDFVFEGTSLDAYRLLIVPSLYLVKPGVAEKLSAWVEAGGIAIFTYFSGIVDECDHVYPGGYPGPLRDLLGLEVEEWAIPPSDAETLTVEATEAGKAAGLSGPYTCGFWAEVVRPITATPMAVFQETWLVDRPALTRHAVGKGAAWYVAGQFQEDFYRDLLITIAEEAGVVAPLSVPAGVEAIERHQGHRSYLFLLNHNPHAVEIRSPRLCGDERLSRSRVDGFISLPPLGVAIVAANVNP